MNDNSFMSREELSQVGFKSYGDNVLVSRYARFYNPGKISLGSNVRIDDFSILSGEIQLGDYIHISAYVALYGGNAGIVMEDYSGLSARCAVYAVTDDFSGGCIANAMVPKNKRNIIEQQVTIGKYAQIGTGSTILPGVIINEGACVGSMSLVNKTLEAWGMYVGIPCRYLKKRKKIDVCQGDDSVE